MWYNSIMKINLHKYVFIGALSLAACSPRVETRGNLPDADALADIEVGQIKKREVAELLGSPSTIATFDLETWYYISEVTETVAFFEPELKERKVIIIRFDKQGVVRELKIIGKEQAREISMVERKTPTAGNEISLLKQLFGNIGRFGTEGEAP